MLQNGAKSTMRSFSTSKLPAGSTTIGPPSLGIAWISKVLQARPAWPLMRIAHEPQIALLQEQRSASVPSNSSRMRD